MKDYRKGMMVSSVLMALLVGSVVYGANTEAPESVKEDHTKMVAMVEDEKKSEIEDVSSRENTILEEGVEATSETMEVTGNGTTTISEEESDGNDQSIVKTSDISGKNGVSEEQKASGSTSDKKPGKPSGNDSSSNNNDNKPAESKPSKPEEKPSKPSKPGHQHSWVVQKKTINHPEKGHNEKVLVKDAWTEKIPRYKDVAVDVCNTCDADITGNVVAHVKKHILAGEGGSHRTEYKSVFSHYEYVEHPAQYSTKYVVDEKAWTETVVTGYKCSCGATK